jgi:hypothetical protein
MPNDSLAVNRTGNGVTASGLLTKTFPPKRPVDQLVHVEDRVLKDRLHGIVDLIQVVERLTPQDRLDALDVVGVIQEAAALPAMRDGIGHKVGEREIVPHSSLTRMPSDPSGRP